MATFGERLQKLRKEANLTTEQLAEKLGCAKSTLSRYENSLRSPKKDFLEMLSKYFDVSIDYLIGNTEVRNIVDLNNKRNINLGDLPGIINLNDMVRIPVVGTIRAGMPILVEQNIIDYKFVQQEGMQVGEIYFSLEVKGDSMINAGIEEGDFVVVKRQDYIDKEGDIAVVIVNGDEATLKRVYFQPSGIVLQAENPNYPPMLIAESEIKSGYVTIVGKAVKLLKERSL